VISNEKAKDNEKKEAKVISNEKAKDNEKKEA